MDTNSQNNEENGRQNPYSEDGTLMETISLGSCNMDVSPYLYKDYNILNNLLESLKKLQSNPGCTDELKVSIVDNFLKLLSSRDEVTDNLNKLPERIKHLIIDPNTGTPRSKSLIENIRGRFQMLLQEYLESRPIFNPKFFIVWDKGHYRPIFPVEIAVYEHMQEIDWGYKVELNKKEENISLIARATYQAIRDGILYEVFNKLYERFDENYILKIVKNSISVLDLWLEDMTLIHNEECSDERSGKLIHYRELRICKYCLEEFERKIKVDEKEMNAIPYDNLHRQSSSTNTCKKKYYKFINSCFDLVGEAKLKLFSILGEFPNEIPSSWTEWWCHNFSKEEINKIKDIVTRKENPQKLLMKEVKQICKKIAGKFLSRFFKSKLYDKLLDHSFYPYLDFETDEYIYKDEHSRLDKLLSHYMNPENTGKELTPEEIIIEIRKEFPDLTKAQVYHLLRRPETLNMDEVIKSNKAKIAKDYPSETLSGTST